MNTLMSGYVIQATLELGIKTASIVGIKEGYGNSGVNYTYETYEEVMKHFVRKLCKKHAYAYMYGRRLFVDRVCFFFWWRCQ